MYSIIVVPPPGAGDVRRDGQIRLAPGDRLSFGRSAADNDLRIPHDGVSRRAGEITAQGAFWILSNLSAHHTYVVENPEGAGEHIKVGPGRLDAPVPFEFSRIVLPAAGDLLTVEVWAPRHDYRRPGAADGTDGDGFALLDGATTAPAFSVDRTKRYFAVLAALCEPRLRGAPHAPLPTVDQVVDRLRPAWPAASRTSVQWNIDYLAVKLRLKPGPETADTGPRLNGKKESLVSLALRFDLVREDDLIVLAAPAGAPDRAAARTPAPRQAAPRRAAPGRAAR
ncbi:FHA domain-containing protein [Streptomyces sp. NPDC086091]|uniref:FHA domain-containing protein n=1 Tax=Streptomyces sp. NPDC086091 TaxID=3365751 RepID=UPI003808136F